MRIIHAIVRDTKRLRSARRSELTTLVESRSFPPTYKYEGAG